MDDIELCAGCQSQVDAAIDVEIKRLMEFKHKSGLTRENTESVHLFRSSTKPPRWRVIKIVKAN